MELYQNLKYVGKNTRLNFYGNTPWHCTNFVTELSTGEMKILKK